MKTIKLTPSEYFKMWYKLAEQIKKSGKCCDMCDGSGIFSVRTSIMKSRFEHSKCNYCKGLGYRIKYKAIHGVKGCMGAKILSEKLELKIMDDFFCEGGAGGAGGNDRFNGPWGSSTGGAGGTPTNFGGGGGGGGGAGDDPSRRYGGNGGNGYCGCVYIYY